MADEAYTNRATPDVDSNAGTPRGRGLANGSSLSRQASGALRASVSRSSRASGKLLRSFLRGDTPKRRGREVEVEYAQQAIACVERNDLEPLNGLLEAELVDVNATDGDGHTLLDLAVMLNQHGCVRLLQLFGGVETEACASLDGREMGMGMVGRRNHIMAWTNVRRPWNCLRNLVSDFPRPFSPLSLPLHHRH
jgi:hypothetical protein